MNFKTEDILPLGEAEPPPRRTTGGVDGGGWKQNPHLSPQYCGEEQPPPREELPTLQTTACLWSVQIFWETNILLQWLYK